MNMKTESDEECFAAILEEMKQLHAAKNEDYGNVFSDIYKKRGAIYPLNHLEEKLNRAEVLATNRKEPKISQERLRDTLIDLASYSVMWIVELDRVENLRKSAAPGAESSLSGVSMDKPDVCNSEQ